MWRLLVLAAVVRYGSPGLIDPIAGSSDIIGSGGGSCPSDYCSNGGLCVAGVDGGPDTCDCPFGYSGQYCETRECTTLFITTWDQSVPVSGDHNVLGLYTLEPFQSDGRDVYKYYGYDAWLFYLASDGVWLVGETIGSWPAFMVAEWAHEYPDQTYGPFYLWADGTWNEEPTLEIRCSVDPPCESSPCQNGGVCITHARYWNSNPYYSCDCLPGFYGYNCENNTDECASNPCSNGATCVDGDNAYTCDCIFGSIGTHCERVLPFFREKFLVYEADPTAAPVECYVCDSASDDHCDVAQYTLPEEFHNTTNTTQGCGSGACWIVRTAVNGQLVSYQRSCAYNNMECDDILKLENCQEDGETKVCYRCCTADRCNTAQLTGNAVFVLPDSGSGSGGAAYIGPPSLLLLLAAVLFLIVNG
ncbi:fibropellin-3-like isoform X1 [Branchiostoma floridae]|uniref:Fibropellin-3-like isoform X1 n=1 Tax=Branchiostoma floridae TaxID=7739 RepID=A0A9J7N867_BRAFL|nr:fibropellin-3-like isoform X1 [Branchiostoma floridae]